ncbi:jg20394 [Pararge aegeria aegeria]|uniref:Jg20394 protein n=1 Tax=Pararge aegeria aegeria TaxID=348720 RepID=A0A8S4S507_9NEOP|nr:jg20394 [Pararge aegeria aegeria]
MGISHKSHERKSDKETQSPVLKIFKDMMQREKTNPTTQAAQIGINLTSTVRLPFKICKRTNIRAETDPEVRFIKMKGEKVGGFGFVNATKLIAFNFNV